MRRLLYIISNIIPKVGEPNRRYAPKIMIRLPLPAITVWVAAGMVAGWWLHVFYQSSSFPGVELGFSGKPKTGEAEKPEEDAADPPPPTEIETLIEQGDYEIAFSRFGQTRVRNQETVQRNQTAIITSLTQLNEEDPEEAQPLLRRFLEEDAYNPRGLFLLSKSYFESGQYMRALETLFNLKSFNQAEVPEEDVNSLIDQIETEYALQLEEGERLSDLLQLYEFLTRQSPEDLALFYKLAGVQNRLRHYYDALASLNHVIYDPTWGKLAQTLVEEIQQSIDLDDEVQVPLQRAGEHFIVTARINGIDGARLMIDTGASLCVLRPQTAQQFGLPTDSEDYVTLNLVAGVFNAPRIEIGTLSVGDASVRNIQASVIEMPPSVETDGLLGMNFLNNFKFFIDQKREILYLGSR